MRFVFILGRNLELSIAEVVSYLKKENFKIIDYTILDNQLIIEINKEMVIPL